MNPNQPSSSLWAAAAQNSIGSRTLSKPAGLAPGAFSAIVAPRSFAQVAQSGPSIFDAPSGSSNDFDMSGMEQEAAVLGTAQPSNTLSAFGQPAQNAFGAPRPASNAFGAPAPSFAQPTSNAFGQPFGQPSQPSNNAFGPPAQPSVNAFGQPSNQPVASSFGQPVQPAATSFGQPRSAFGPGGMGMPVQSAFGPGGMGPPAAPSFGQPAPSAFGQPKPPPPVTFAPPPPSTFGQAPKPSPFAQPIASPFGQPQSQPSAFSTPSPFSQPSPASNAFSQPGPAPVPAANSFAQPPAPSSAPSFGQAMQQANRPTGFGGQPSTPTKPPTSQPASSTTPAGAPANPPKEVTDAFFKGIFAKKSETPATPPSASTSAPAMGSTTPQSTPPPAFGKAAAPPAPPAPPAPADESPSTEVDGKEAEAFKAFKTKDPFERFKAPQQSSWLDEPQKKAEWEIKLEESRKKREEAGAKTTFDNSAFTTAQIEERRKMRAEEHALEHDDEDEDEEEEKDEEEKFPEEKLTSKEPAAPKAAVPAAGAAKLNDNLLGLSLGSTSSTPPAVPKVTEKASDETVQSKNIPAKSSSPIPTTATKGPATPEVAAAASVGLGRPSSRPTSGFAPTKSSPLATPPASAGPSAAPVKPTSASMNLNPKKKMEEQPSQSPTAAPAAPAPQHIKTEPEAPAPAAILPSFGRLSTSTAKPSILKAEPEAPIKKKPSVAGGWPDEPIPKFRFTSAVASDSKVESTARELEKARQVIDEGLRQMRQTVERCRAYHQQLKEQSLYNKGIEHITEPKRWNFADLGTLTGVVNEVQAGTLPLKDKDVSYRRMSVEIDSLVLKAETKKEECARFKRAHDDKDVASILRIRRLGPEQSENQTRLRHSSLLVHNQLERLEDYVVAVKAKVEQKKAGVKPLTGPALDTINRTIRHLDTAAATKLAQLETLKEKLVAAKEAYSAQLPVRLSSPQEKESNSTIESAIPSADKQASKSPSVSSGVLTARLRAAFLEKRNTPLINTMARQFAAAGDPSILETDLSLAIYNGPLTLDMPAPKEEEPVVPVKMEEPAVETTDAVTKSEDAVIKTEEPAIAPQTTEETPATGSFAFSGPLPAGWEALKNAPYKPIELEVPPPVARHHKHRSERLGSRSKESHGKQSSSEADLLTKATPAMSLEPGVSGTSSQVDHPVGSASSGGVALTSLPTNNLFAMIPPVDKDMPKAPLWPSAPVVAKPAFPVAELPKKNWLASLPPLKKDALKAPAPVAKLPTSFVPIVGSKAQAVPSQQEQDKIRQAWGNLGPSKAPASSTPLTTPAPKPPIFSSVAPPPPPPTLPAAWKAAVDAVITPTTPAVNNAASPSPSRAAVETKSTSSPKSLPLSSPAPSKATTPPVPASGSTSEVKGSMLKSSLDKALGGYDLFGSPPPSAKVMADDASDKSSPVKSPPIKSPTIKSPTIQSPTIKSPAIQSPPIKSPAIQSPSEQAAGAKQFDFSALRKAVPSTSAAPPVKPDEVSIKSPTTQPAMSPKAFDFSGLTKAAQAAGPASPSPKSDEVRSPAASGSKAFDFSVFTKNAATAPKPAGIPSFSDLLRKSGVTLSSGTAGTSASQHIQLQPVASGPGRAGSPSPSPTATPSPVPSGVRSPPLQAMFGSKSAFGAGGFGMPTASPAPAAAPVKSAFGPGGAGMPTSSSPSIGTTSAFGPGGYGQPSSQTTPSVPSGHRSAFGPGGMGTPVSEGSTTPPAAKSPNPAPIGGTFGMHHGGISGAFGNSGAASHSIFAKPEGWTPPAASSSTNVFKPVVVPTSTAPSGNPDWAKRFAHLQAAGNEEEEEEEEEGQEEYYGDYQDEVEYDAQARELSDLEEAEKEYEVVDE